MQSMYPTLTPSCQKRQRQSFNGEEPFCFLDRTATRSILLVSVFLTAAACRLWRALRFATRCRGVVAFHKGRCIMHCGMAAPGTVPGSATVGPIGAAAMKSGSGNYLANLILFPGAPHVGHLHYGAQDASSRAGEPC